MYTVGICGSYKSDIPEMHDIMDIVGIPGTTEKSEIVIEVDILDIMGIK